MKTTIFVEAGKVETREAPKPVIKADDDVILRVVRACVCGSDLWSYRGQDGKSNIPRIRAMKRSVLLKKPVLLLRR